nr:retrovirus-related Pol polyprotein from transposon TNT 1-94 [Tanacetum cinerariifolium]
MIFVHRKGSKESLAMLGLLSRMHKASLTDDFSRFTWTFFLKTKDETSGILRKFITEIENLKDLKVKITRCDNGGEFRNKEMNDFCSQKGTKREFSNAKTPQRNGVAERKNKTLIEAARTMLADAKLPVTFWAEAVNTACYVQNRVLVNKSQNKTPYELFNGRTPAIGFLKPFGCDVMILNTLENLGKFKAKRDEGFFIRYSMSSKAFRVFNKRTGRVKENLHVEFLENKAIEKGAGPDYKPQDDCSSNVPESSENSNPTATSTNPPADHLETLTVETPIPTVSSPVVTACLNDSPEPSNILRVTTNSVDSDGVEADVTNMETNVTASPTPTLRIHKDHPKSQIIGHTQEEWIDYDEVFAPVARIEAIRIFLAYASFMGFIVYQMDVKSAFLYGTIDDEVSSNTPMDKENPWGKDRTGKDVELHLYRSMIGSLIYLTASRPDIMFAVCACARHQVTPKECHLHAVKRIFRYLKGHPKLGLWYPKASPFDLVAYSDSDYGGASQDRKSTTGGS